MIFRILEIYAKIIEGVMKILMGILLIVVALQVTGRYVPFIPRYLWTIEVSDFSLIWIIFLGSIIGVREEKHFFLDIFSDNLKPGMNKFIKMIYFICMYIVSLIFVMYGYQYFIMGCIQHSNLTGMNLGIIYISVPLSGISWIIFLTEKIYKK